MIWVVKRIIMQERYTGERNEQDQQKQKGNKRIKNNRRRGKIGEEKEE